MLGLTLLAWGNSLGDFFSNRAMARAGHASTALTACFAAPLFNMLLSLAVGFGSLLTRSGSEGGGDGTASSRLPSPSAVPVRLTPELALGCGFLLAYNLAIMALARWYQGRLPAWFAQAARAWYALYFVLACVGGLVR